nr:serine kinase [Oceaniglobus trochenteri]
MITGAAGSGKSALALWMMAFGCHLVADDRTEVSLRHGQLYARAPNSLPPLIEARGIGLLPATLAGGSRLIVVADLDIGPTDRLPPPRATTLVGCEIPLVAGQGCAHLAPALLQILKTGQVPSHD